MKPGKKIAFFLVLAMAFTLFTVQLTGCAKPQRKPEPKSGSTQKAPPAKLEMVENLAREIYKAAGAKDWENAQSSLSTLQKDWPDLKKKFSTANVPSEQISGFDAKVRQLNTAVKAKEKKKTQDIANAMTGQLVDISRHFNGKIPPDLNKIGYYLRETVLGAEYNDMSRIERNYKMADISWRTVRNRVNQNTTGEINFQDKLDSLKMAVTNKQKNNVKKFGNESLNALDKIKVDFRK